MSNDPNSRPNADSNSNSDNLDSRHGNGLGTTPGFDPVPIRAYLEGIGYPVDPARLVAAEAQRPSTLCYLQDSGRLLMLKRRKEPFSKHWTAPGGKIEAGETPLDAIVREMREETGLEVTDPELKVVCSETGDTYYNWLLFIFQARAYKGELTPSDEGELRWLSLDALTDWELPDVDRRLLRYILDDTETPHFIRVKYARDHSVAEFHTSSLAEFNG